MSRHRAETPEPAAPRVTEREMPVMADVRVRGRIQAMAGEHLRHAAYGLNLPDNVRSAMNSVARAHSDVVDLHDSIRVVAADVLAMAQAGGMPDTYWLTDRRIKRACQVLDLHPVEARQIDWADLPTPR